MPKSKAKILSLATYLRKLRDDNEYTLEEVATATGIAMAVLSKIETGNRKINKEQLLSLSRLYKDFSKELSILYLTERVMEVLEKELNAPEVIKIISKQLADKQKKKKKK